MFHRVVAVLVGLTGFALLNTSAHAQTFLGPTPYLCFSDSPFNGLALQYFHLETFEDHLFNVPGVSADHGGVTSVVFGPAIHDSVDCDDGTIDGSGLNGDSFFSSTPDIRFTFNAAVLGSLPTHAGIVWTDGGSNTTVTFEAYNAAGASLGTVVAQVGDGSNNGTTAEDRFFGVVYDQGIQAIRIRHSSGGLEVDHLQYGGGPGGCPSDINHDGFVDDADFTLFVTGYNILDCADPTMPAGCPADANHDGFVDDSDFTLFISAYNQLLCP
ncbi:MAG: hypothetical protein ACREJD_12420 [Phycisphaerales bacterium]